MAVGQVGTKGRYKKELAHDEDQGDGSHAQQVFKGGFVADDHMAGDGIEQHLQAAAGAVLGQHLDELDADDDVECPLQKGADLYIVAVNEQAGHPLDEGHDADEQADEHQAGEGDLEQGGGLDDEIAQLRAASAFDMGGVVEIVGHGRDLSFGFGFKCSGQNREKMSTLFSIF